MLWTRCFLLLYWVDGRRGAEGAEMTPRPLIGNQEALSRLLLFPILSIEVSHYCWDPVVWWDLGLERESCGSVLYVALQFQWTSGCLASYCTELLFSGGKEERGPYCRMENKYHQKDSWKKSWSLF